MDAIEILLIVLDVVCQVALPLAGDAAAESAGAAVRRRRRRRGVPPPVPGPGRAIALLALLFVVGAAVGALSTLAIPERLLPRLHVPGLSLVLSPLVCGAVMHSYGKWRRARGGDTTIAASFTGGALFALGTALARLLLVA